MDIKLIEEQFAAARELIIAKRFEEARTMLWAIYQANKDTKLYRLPAFTAVVTADKAFVDYILEGPPMETLPSDVVAQYKKS